MRPAISWAITAVIITAIRSSASAVVNIDSYRDVWPEDVPILVSPKKASYITTLFTDLSKGCIHSYGCNCYMWQSPMWITRFPPLEPGQIMCSNISLVLERHENVIPGIALVPPGMGLIHWRIIRYDACETIASNSIVRIAFAESVIAAATKHTTVCAVGGLDEQAVSVTHIKSSPLSFSTNIAVMIVLGVVIAAAALHVVATSLVM